MWEVKTELKQLLLDLFPDAGNLRRWLQESRLADIVDHLPSATASKDAFVHTAADMLVARGLVDDALCFDLALYAPGRRQDVARFKASHLDFSLSRTHQDDLGALVEGLQRRLAAQGEQIGHLAMELSRKSAELERAQGDLKTFQERCQGMVQENREQAIKLRKVNEKKRALKAEVKELRERSALLASPKFRLFARISMEKLDEYLEENDREPAFGEDLILVAIEICEADGDLDNVEKLFDKRMLANFIDAEGGYAGLSPSFTSLLTEAVKLAELDVY